MTTQLLHAADAAFSIVEHLFGFTAGEVAEVPVGKKGLQALHDRPRRLGTPLRGLLQQLVATLDGRPVGYLTTHIGPEPDEAHIEYLAVTASARRRGIGRALLRAGLRWLFEEEAMAKVFLTVHSDNDRALALYRSVGFQSHSVGVPLSWTPARSSSG